MANKKIPTATSKTNTTEFIAVSNFSHKRAIAVNKAPNALKTKSDVLFFIVKGSILIF